jgi:hypothetical protein
MMWLGLILLVLGFVLVAPRGATPGSASVRIVHMGAASFFKTPGYQEEPSAKARRGRTIVGLVMLLAGGTIMWFAV